MITGYRRLETFLRRSAGIEIGKSDAERLVDLIDEKVNDLLVIGERNASYNNRDVIMEPDLPLTKGFLEEMREFRGFDEELELEPVLEAVTPYPPLGRALSLEVEAMLPEIAGTLAMTAGKTMKIIDPEKKNPDPVTWERVFALMKLML